MIRMMDSHAYPGCPAVADEPPKEGPVHVEFSDGSVAGGSIARVGEGRITLTIDAYRTHSGTAIAAKSWLLEAQGGDRWRVVRRLQDGA